MEAPETSILASALELARKGHPVFPVGRDKKPLIKDWPHQASINEKQIRAWFDKPAPPNLAIITDDKSGMFVLDVDGAEGLANLAELEKRHGALSRDCAVRTPSGGLHLYFKMPGFDLRNSAGKLAPSLDIRANGGYVLASPSQAVNRDGQLGKYVWLSEATPADAEPPESPAWLLDLLRGESHAPVPSRRQVTSSTGTAYGLKALEEECNRVATAPQGTRNDTLNRAAFAVFQLVEGGELERREAESALEYAAVQIGLPVKEVQATLRSAASKAAMNPRSAPEPVQAQVVTSQCSLPAPSSQPPLEIFPPKIQKMLKEAAVAFKHLPIEVPIVAFLAMLSACIGQSRVLVVKDNWEEAGNLYLALVANSGLGKSPCFKEFLKPLWRAEVKNKESWDSAMDGYNTIIEEQRRNKEKSESGFVPSKPVRVQHIIEDASHH